MLEYQVDTNYLYKTMLYDKNSNTIIKLPKDLWAELISHCQRKLSGNFLADENQSLKAFGLIGGHHENDTISAKIVIPLLKNARGSKSHREFMDEKMESHAIPSVTPFEERGWVADQGEVDRAVTSFSSKGYSLLGTYHMHRVPWDHDPIRDTPTELDVMLGQGSRMLMFIISMVDSTSPIIKAFFEGVLDQEVPIEIS